VKGLINHLKNLMKISIRDRVSKWNSPVLSGSESANYGQYMWLDRERETK
jgi:hypothetical protein